MQLPGVTITLVTLFYLRVELGRLVLRDGVWHLTQVFFFLLHTFRD